jgi:flagellar L-ring protein precursor FlgH
MINLNKTLKQTYFFTLLGVLLIFSGCTSMFNQLKNVGKPPEINKVNVYNKDNLDEVYSKTVQNKDESLSSNSLWTPDSKTFFFRERKAKDVGDILKIKIVIEDKAKLNNKTTKSRKSGKDFGMPNLFGLENTIKNKIPADPKKLMKIDSDSNSTGDGQIDRKETISTNIAATIIRILPNGNFLITGSQEIRVNYELREITVAGIVRPEDIGSDNSVDLDQIAEARVSYGGRGQISQYQQDPYGKQILDIISPF